MAMLGKVPVHHYAGDNTSLGTACGKFFNCSILTILDGGDSDILTSTTTAISKSSSLSMSSSADSSFHSLSGVKSDGSTVSTSDFEGKVVYATNVASQ